MQRFISSGYSTSHNQTAETDSWLMNALQIVLRVVKLALEPHFTTLKHAKVGLQVRSYLIFQRTVASRFVPSAQAERAQSAK